MSSQKSDSQTASVQTLLDDVERVVPAGLDDAVAFQFAEEIALLGRRCAELASILRSIQTQAHVEREATDSE